MPLEVGRGRWAGDRSTGSRECGLTLTRQAPASATATVEIDGPPSTTWADLADHEAFQAALVNAALDVARGRTFSELLDVLDDAGVDALHGSYRTLLGRTAAGNRRAMWDLLRATRRLGTGRSPLEDVLGAARLFGHDDVEATPTVAVRVGQDFRDLRAEQRRETCELLSTIAGGCDVRLVATGLVQRWLVDHHRVDLPVSREDIAPPGSGLLRERVERARAALDPDGREVAVLGALADEDAATLPYGALYAEVHVSASRVRQVVGRLVDLGLVDTFDGPAGRTVELLPAGSAFLDVLDEEIGRQRTLQDSVSGTGQRSDHAVYSAPAHEAAPEGAPGGHREGPVDVAYLSRWKHAAAAGSRREGGVTLVDHPVEALDDGRQPGWSYDADADRIVISAEYHNPLQYLTCVALALTDWRTFEQVLDEDRLDGEDGELSGLSVDDLVVLRDARCLGFLKDADATGAGFADALEDAADHLRGMTRKLHHGEYDDCDRFRSAITRDALGLASTMVHVLDLAGVDVVREVRLPEFTRNYDRDRRRDLVRSVAIGAAIQSTYSEFAAYRQLFEDRPDRREAALSPRVDAADPYGELIGSFVLVGPGVDVLEADLVAALGSPRDLHEDAPEFAIRVAVGPPDRTAYARTTRAMCRAKNLDATREAVSVLEAFTGSPYDAARALHGLAPEDVRREVRVDVVRFALSTLPSSRVLPAAKPSISAMARALLATDDPMTQVDLADAAGVSARSVRRHVERLVAMGLVLDVQRGYRLALSTRTERHRDVLPWYATPNAERDDYRDATEKGVLWEAAVTLDEAGVDDILEAVVSISTLQVNGEDRRAIATAWPWARPLLDAVRAFAAEELDHRLPVDRTVEFGAPVEQAPLESTVAAGGPDLRRRP